MRVVIAEFMDEAAVASLQRRFVTTYDAGLASGAMRCFSRCLRPRR